MYKCLNCGAEFSGKFCPECGTKWQEDKTCPNCGNKVKPQTRYCPECGYSFTDMPTAEKKENLSQPANCGQPVWNNGQNTVATKSVATPTDKLGKLYSLLKYIPTMLLGLFGLLSLLFFIGPVAVAKAFGETEATSSLYKFAFGSAEELELLEDLINFQASGLALFIVSMLTVVCAGIAAFYTFSEQNRFKTVTLGKLTLGIGEFISCAGTLFMFAAFITGCVICGQVSTLDKEVAGGFGLYKAGAAPILSVVFGIIFILLIVASMVVKIVLGKKFPAFVDAENEKRAAAEKAFNEKQAEAATAVADTDIVNNTENAGSARNGSSLLNGRPAGLSIISFIRMHRILAFFTLVLILAMCAATTLIWLEFTGDVGHYLPTVFWSTFGVLLFIVALSLLIPVNLQKWTPTKILKNGSKGKIVGAAFSLFFSLTPLSAVICFKVLEFYDILLREPLIISIFGVLVSVFMIILAVAASKKGDRMSEYFYGSVQNRGNLSVVDYNPDTAQQEIKNYKSVKTGRAKAKPDGLLIAAATLFLVVIIGMAAIFPTMTNKFSAGTLSELKMGTSCEAVRIYLGDPDEGVDKREDYYNKTGSYFYFSDNYRQIYKEMEQIEKDYGNALETGDFKTMASLEKKLENLENQLKKLNYKYIMISFDKGSLTSVTYDASCTYDEKDKKIDTIKLSQTNAYVSSNLSEITAQITYTDGSYRYYSLSDVRLSFDREVGRQKVEWRDMWGEYSANITLEEKVSGTVGDISWELKRENGSDVLSFAGSGELTSEYFINNESYSIPWIRYKTIIDKIRIGNRITKIDYWTFSSCKDYTSLREVEIGSGVRDIEYHAFYNCSAIIRIAAPESASYSWDSDWKGSDCVVIWDCYDIGVSGQSYVVSFNSNGGSSCPSMNGPTINTLPTPTKSGYSFGGWYESPQFSGYPVTAPYTVSSSGATLYAKWDPIQNIEDGSSFSKAITATEGTTNTVNITTGGQKVYYKFTPSVSGSYTIESSGSKDTIVLLYSESNTSSSLASDDDSGSNSNFRLTRNLQSGTTYYIVVNIYGSGTGSFNFTVTR